MNIVHFSSKDKTQVESCSARFESRANQNFFECNQVDVDDYDEDDDDNNSNNVDDYETPYVDELSPIGPCYRFVGDKLDRVQAHTQRVTRRSFAQSQHQSQLSLCTFAATDVQRALLKSSQAGNVSSGRNNRYNQRAGVTLDDSEGERNSYGGIGAGLQANVVCINSNGHLRGENAALGQKLSHQDQRERCSSASGCGGTRTCSGNKLRPSPPPQPHQVGNGQRRGSGNKVAVARDSAVADGTRSSTTTTLSNLHRPLGEDADSSVNVEQLNWRMGWKMKQAHSFGMLPPKECIYESSVSSASASSSLSSSSSVSLRKQKLLQVYAESDSVRCVEANNQPEHQSSLALPPHTLWSTSASSSSPPPPRPSVSVLSPLLLSSVPSSSSRLLNRLGWRPTPAPTTSESAIGDSNDHSEQLGSKGSLPTDQRLYRSSSSASDLIDAVRGITQLASNSSKPCSRGATVHKHQQHQQQQHWQLNNLRPSKSSGYLDRAPQQEKIVEEAEEEGAEVEENGVFHRGLASSAPDAQFCSSTTGLNNLLHDAANRAIGARQYSKILHRPERCNILSRKQASKMLHSSVQSLSMQLDQATMRQQIQYAPNQQQTGATSVLGPNTVSQSPALSRSVLDGLNADQLSSSQSSANKLGRLVGKKAARIKEIVLQNLGRAEKTTDELFEVYEQNFFKQHSKTTKLSKEFKNYMNALKGFHDARRSLNKCIQSATSDYQSARHDLVCENLSQLEQLNDDLVEKLREQVTSRLSEYLSQFNDIKDKVSKRKRKMIDYDSSRRAYELFMNDISKKRQRQQQQQQQQQQQGSNCRRSDGVAGTLSSVNDGSTSDLTSQLFDEARLLKLREQFNYCKIMYEGINTELHEELPSVYEKRMKHLLKALQSYFALEAHYYSNANKLSATASEVIDELPMLPIATLRKPSKSCAERNNANDNNKYTDATLVVPAQAAHSGGSSGVGSSRGESSLDSASEGSAAGEASGAGSSGGGRAGSPSTVTSDDDEEEEDDDDGDDEKEGGGEAELEPKLGPEPEAKESPNVLEVVSDAASNDAPETGKEIAPPQQEDTTDEVVAARCEPASPAQDSCVDECITCSTDCASGEPVMSKKEPTSEDKQSTGGEQGKPEEESLYSEIKPVAQSESVGSDQPVSKEEGEKEEAKESVDVVEVAVEEANGAKQNTKRALYKVKSNYKYLAEDVDELCFEPDEIIQVVEFDSEHEPEEGWLMGVREVNGQKGLFPANFTQPL